MNAISDQRRREIISAFQASFKRDNKQDLEQIGLEELIAADEMLGPRGQEAGFRIRMRNRISELKEKRANQAITRSRWFDRLLGFIIGLVVTVGGVALTNWMGL